MLEPATKMKELDDLTEEEIRRAVDAANIPALLMLVFQITGDRKWLEPPFRPTRGKGLTDHDSGGLPPDVQDAIREAGAAAIIAMKGGRAPAISVPDPVLIVEMMSVCIGEEIPARYGPMLSSEFAKRAAADSVASTDGAKPPPGFNAIVIGAGVAGIVAAKHLSELGVDYKILERADQPGGVWWQNTYPGAGVDTPSHLYSFSFAKGDWLMHFELRDELQRYLARVLDEVVEPDRVEFGTMVRSATFDAASAEWVLQVQRGNGEEAELRANVLVSAVGSLSRPRTPDIRNASAFTGASAHSAEWPSDLDIAGKRVVVVGTGASAMQIVPAIADEAAQLTIVQRSPAWVAPFEKFNQPIPPSVRQLLHAVPIYHAWYWLRLFWQFGDKVVESLRVDPNWPHPERSVNRRNDGHRQYFSRYLEEKLAGRDDLICRSLPNYPPFGKRILLDNGWFDALLKPTVALISGAVTELSESEVVLDSGERIEADVIIWATGFDSTRFVSSFEVHGTHGETLREAWEDDNPKAYLGISVPHFPNFLILGGPTAFPGSGSFMFSMEMQMTYIDKILLTMFDEGLRTIEPTEFANDDYNDRVDQLHSETVWTHRGMSTYYRNSRGRVVYVMPFLAVDYWAMIQDVGLENYVVGKVVEAEGASK